MGLVAGRPVHGVHFDVHGPKIPGLFGLLGRPEACTDLSTGDLEAPAAHVFACMAETSPDEGIAERIAALRQATLDWMRADWMAPTAGSRLEGVQALGALATRLDDEASERAAAFARKQVSAVEKQNQTLGRVEKLLLAREQKDSRAGQLEKEIEKLLSAREQQDLPGGPTREGDREAALGWEQKDSRAGQLEKEIEKLLSAREQQADLRAGQLEKEIEKLLSAREQQDLRAGQLEKEIEKLLSAREQQDLRAGQLEDQLRSTREALEAGTRQAAERARADADENHGLKEHARASEQKIRKLEERARMLEQSASFRLQKIRKLEERARMLEQIDLVPARSCAGARRAVAGWRSLVCR